MSGTVPGRIGHFQLQRLVQLVDAVENKQDHLQPPSTQCRHHPFEAAFQEASRSLNRAQRGRGGRDATLVKALLPRVLGADPVRAQESRRRLPPRRSCHVACDVAQIR